jgi:SAM-dependent methyltransferase
MESYLNQNANYWANPYQAPHVESFIFRFYGRILKFDFGIDGSNHEKILDFGCGQGGALQFFDKQGFNCFGVDIAKPDIEAARQIMPHIANQFQIIDPKPSELNVFFDGNFDIVISIQTLDWLSNSDFKKCVRSLYNSMKPGAKIYASMNSWDMYYRNNATPAEDGLWHCKFKTKGPLQNPKLKQDYRVNYDFYLNFVKDKSEMRERFSLFEPIYIDEYSGSFREEGLERRYTFFGVKR